MPYSSAANRARLRRRRPRWGASACWAASWCSAERATSSAPATPPRSSGPRHVARTRGSTQASGAGHHARGHASHSRGERIAEPSRCLSCRPLLDSGRSRSPHRRSRERCALTWRTRSRHPHRAKRECAARDSWRLLGRPLPFARAHESARRPQRARLRPHEREETLSNVG